MQANNRPACRASNTNENGASGNLTAVRLPKPQQESAPPIEVFDFRKNWHVVKPFLQHPKVTRALERGMNGYLAMRRQECAERGVGEDRWKFKYNPASGPWAYDSSDRWLMLTDDLFNAAVARGEFVWNLGDNEESELERSFEFRQQFYPQPDTLEWYQLFGACHWLAPFLKQLGKLAFPQWKWKGISGPLHSLAAGCDSAGNVRVVFDILNFDTRTAAQLLEFATASEEAELSWSE
jgi:hypothetical protein